jgi:hypothetical protein
MGSFLVFDIETIKDLPMIEEIANEEQKKKMLDDGEFPPLHFHRVVSISVLISNGNSSLFKSWCYEDEEMVLHFFWKAFSKLNNPTFVSFNGKSFDLPVLILRSLQFPSMLEKDEVDKAFRILTDNSDKWENSKPNYFNRYTQYHIDLMELFGVYRKYSLKAICYLCGIPVKTEGEGSKVENMFYDGKLEEIARYCAEDVKATALLFSYLNKHIFKNDDFLEFEEIQKLEPEIFT